MGRTLLMLADTITPVMVAHIGYLFVLNGLIGLLEGAMLRRLFGGGRRAVWWMILANYVSGWLGYFGVFYILSPRTNAFLGSRPIERVNLLAALIAITAFAISVLIEAGFVRLALERAKRSLSRVALATLSVNAVSYLLVCGWFLCQSFSLPFNAHVAQISEFGSIPSGTLYWVDPTGQVMAQDIHVAQPVHRVGAVTQNDFVVPYQLRVERADDSGRTKLTAQYSMISYSDRRPPDDLKDPDPLVLADLRPTGVFPKDYWQQPRMLRMQVLDLRPIDRRKMRVRFDWYRRFLDTDVPGGPHCHLCIGLAMLDWDMQEPVILPDDKIVFEWGGQILLFDPHTTKLAFIVSGTCPAFVPDAK